MNKLLINARYMVRFFCGLVLILMSASMGAQTETPANDAGVSDGVIRLSDTITGNREQPKVLYVVPWQKAEDKSILYQSLKSNFGSVFGQIDEAEHKREIEFLDSFLEQRSKQE